MLPENDARTSDGRSTSRARGVTRVRAALAIAAAAAIGVTVYATLIRPSLWPRRFGVVRDGQIYRSGRMTTAALSHVHDRYGIKTIVDLGGYHAGSADDRREAQAAEALGITRHSFRLEGDGTGDVNIYADALRIMADPASQPVLVHCSAGTERTGCAVMLYRQIYENVGLERALTEAQQFDHEPGKNPHVRAIAERWAGPIKEAVRTGREVDTGGESKMVR